MEDSNSEDSGTEFYKSIANNLNHVKSELKNRTQQEVVNSLNSDQPSASSLQNSTVLNFFDKPKRTKSTPQKRKIENTPKKVEKPFPETKASDFEQKLMLEIQHSFGFPLPSTSAICTSTPNNFFDNTNTTAHKAKRRKSNKVQSKATPNSRSRKKTKNTDVKIDYSPPVTRQRNYSKLTTSELDDLRNRIKVFHETGVILPKKTVVMPCNSKKGKHKNANTNKSYGEQIPGSHLGKGNIGVACSKFGTTGCSCCNNTHTVTTYKDVLKELSNIRTCAEFGIQDCMCCSREDIFLHVDADTPLKKEVLLVHDVQADHLLQRGHAENSGSSINLEVTSQLPSSVLPKDKIIQKFFDSFTHDRVDYIKPQQKNIVEGLIHNPVSNYAEHLKEDVDVPEKTILERIDFKKEEERLAKLLESFNNPSTSTGNPTTPSFKPLKANATSTPLPELTVCKTEFELPTKVLEKSLDCIESVANAEYQQTPTTLGLERREGSKIVEPLEANVTSTPLPELTVCRTEFELPTKVLEKPVDCIESVGNADAEYQQASTTLELERREGSKIVEPSDNFDMSTVDTSFVTLRTPLKSRKYIVDEGTESDEDAIMEYVNTLVAKDEQNIVEECQMRCQRLLECRENTRNAMYDALQAIEIVDDDIFDNSVQIIDNTIECLSDDKASNGSVELISDSDIQLISVPSTSSSRPPKIKNRKKQLPTPTEYLELDDESPVKDKKGIGDCSICLEPLNAAKELSSTTCGHIFCTACIKPVIKANKKCPICRSNLTLKKVHPLFLF